MTSKIDLDDQIHLPPLPVARTRSRFFPRIDSANVVAFNKPVASEVDAKLRDASRILPPDTPEVEACMALIRQGKAATVRGRDIGKGLINLTAKIAKRRNLKGKTMVESLQSYRIEMDARMSHPKQEKQRQSMLDKIDTLIVLIEEANDWAKLRTKIESIFSESEGGKNVILCSTVHKAKGLEATNVFIVRPELMPFPYATREWEQEQEMHLKYVAITRARINLNWVMTPSPKADQPDDRED